MLKALSLLFISLLFADQSLAQTCAGFPIVNGFRSDIAQSCLGLVATENEVPWAMPRQILFIENSKVVVSDLGGWGSKSNGKVFEIDLKTMESEVIYSGGFFTHGLGLDSKQRLLVGDANKIIRIEQGIQTVVLEGLPGEGSHPITHFIVLPNNDLVVNVGAPSDNCTEEMGGGTHCPSRDVEGEVRLYPYNIATDSYFPVHRDLGRGLRNSMALLHNPVLDVIYQAENNIDIKGTPEEFNEMPLDSNEPLDFGWPFCYGLGNRAPYVSNTFDNFCSGHRTQAPKFLIPNHSAPLDMDYYSGWAFSELKNSIIMGWHGHRRQDENAIVAYPADHMMAPVVSSQEDNDYIRVLSGYNMSTGDKLRPVGITNDLQGRLWFVDDKTKRLYVFAPSEFAVGGSAGGFSFAEKNQEFVKALDVEKKDEFEKIYFELRNKSTCVECHSDSEFPSRGEEALLSFLNKKWIVPGQKAVESTLLLRMSGESPSPRSMPPAPAAPFETTNPEVFNELKNWVDQNLSQ